MVAIPRLLSRHVATPLLCEECDEEREMREERTPMVDAERNCCFVDFEATGTASLRRNTLAEATMVEMYDGGMVTFLLLGCGLFGARGIL